LNHYYGSPDKIACKHFIWLDSTIFCTTEQNTYVQATHTSDTFLFWSWESPLFHLFFNSYVQNPWFSSIYKSLFCWRQTIETEVFGLKFKTLLVLPLVLTRMPICIRNCPAALGFIEIGTLTPKTRMATKKDCSV
jgi:hypothetical protein